MVRHYYVRLDADTVRPSRIDVHAIKLLELEAGVQTSCPFQYNNDDNDHQDDEPNIMQISSYYDDDSLNNLFKDKVN